jgi:hypothetical protein
MAQQTAVAPQVAPARARWPAPVGSIQAFDPWPLNWLFIAWSTMEEPVHVDNDGRLVLALATAPRWLEDGTLEIHCAKVRGATTRSVSSGTPATLVTRECGAGGESMATGDRRAEVRREGNLSLAAGRTREESGYGARRRTPPSAAPIRMEVMPGL